MVAKLWAALLGELGLRASDADGEAEAEAAKAATEAATESEAERGAKEYRAKIKALDLSEARRELAAAQRITDGLRRALDVVDSHSGELQGLKVEPPSEANKATVLRHAGRNASELKGEIKTMGAEVERVQAKVMRLEAAEAAAKDAAASAATAAAAAAGKAAEAAKQVPPRAK